MLYNKIIMSSLNQFTYDYWNRIYLCTLKKPTQYECMEFNSFEEADKYYKKKKIKLFSAP